MIWQHFQLPTDPTYLPPTTSSINRDHYSAIEQHFTPIPPDSTSLLDWHLGPDGVLHETK